VENYYSLNPLLFRFREEMITSMRDAIQVSKLDISSPLRGRYSSRRLALPSIDKIKLNDISAPNNSDHNIS
jgi:hypothetical protein